MVCWGGNISKRQRGRLDKIVNKGGDGQVVGISGQNTEEVYFRRVKCKLAAILNDFTRALYSDFDSSRVEGGGRLQVPLARTNRLKLSFLPSAISMFNRSFEHK